MTPILMNIFFHVRIPVFKVLTKKNRDAARHVSTFFSFIIAYFLASIIISSIFMAASGIIVPGPKIAIAPAL